MSHSGILRTLAGVAPGPVHPFSGFDPGAIAALPRVAGGGVCPLAVL